MSESKPLAGADAVEKISHIAKGEVAMLCTFPEGRMKSRPMGTPGIDADGGIWLMTRFDTAKIVEIEAHPGVQLIYALPSRSEYMEVEGIATISRDQSKIDELWSPLMKAWFPDGKDDPAIRLIHIVPAGGHYWDTKHNRMIQLAAIAIGAITGRPLDDGVEGDLNI